MFLYRGESKELRRKNGGRLKPKGEKFTHIFAPSEHLYPSKSILVGECAQNAIVAHQSPKLRDEQNFRSAGISTTPYIRIAKYYATRTYDAASGSFARTDGTIYVIDRSKLRQFEVEQKIVAELVEFPTAPKDEEVILVAKDRGVLPIGIVVRTIRVVPCGFPKLAATS